MLADWGRRPARSEWLLSVMAHSDTLRLPEPVAGGLQSAGRHAGRVNPGFRAYIEKKYHKIVSVVDFIASLGAVGAEAVVLACEVFAGGSRRQWLKVAGGAKAPFMERALGGRSVAEGEVLVEFGTYIGYSSIRLARQVMIRNGGRTGLSPFKGQRLISIEVDPIIAFVARHIINLTMLLCYMEVWTGQIKDLIPRIQEVWGERALAFGFMDYKGSRYHVDFERLEQFDLPAPFCRLVVDNVVSPGAPLLLWNLGHSPAVRQTLYEMQEFLEESIEDWVAVVDYLTPPWGPRQKSPGLVREEQLLEASWWAGHWSEWEGA
mmetsp:Transcript_67724/g.190909  ORF Transcript_67724/g.190909 Transcript_67724/m.190909 type:complete len:320 (+) Transcript_67724:180-1139(+)